MTRINSFLSNCMGKESYPELRIDNRIMKKGSPALATFDGMLIFTYPENKCIVVSRKIYTSNTNALFIEEWQLRNGSDKPIKLSVSSARTVKFTNENIAIVSTCKGVEPVSVKLGETLCDNRHYDSIAGISPGATCDGAPSNMVIMMLDGLSKKYKLKLLTLPDLVSSE